MTQIRLEEKLGLHDHEHPFTPSPDYGSPLGRPAYLMGYELAQMFRRKLGLTGPLRSMRGLVETQLAIPVIQALLGERIAGATVQPSQQHRAIVLNVNGKNADPRVRRTTMAHELAHLLFDPSPQLQDLRVDEYEALDAREDTRADPVEQRANAFAVELLLPKSEAMAHFYSSSEGALGQLIDKFGISFTAGRYQLWNALKRSVPLDGLSAPNGPPNPDWEASETYTLAYHPLRALVNHPSRAGRFSAVVVRAASLGVISWDTAAEWLFCTEDDAKKAQAGMQDLFPDAFRETSSVAKS